MLKNKFIQTAILPVCITLVTLVSFAVISATANKTPKNRQGKVQSTNITTSPLQTVRYETRLKGYGEIVPAEVTQLSTRVSGTVVYWSSQFVRGGIINKEQVLFRLEDSRYLSELKTAEAAILSAKADLEQELGLAQVAKSELARINSDAKNRLFLREPQIQSAYAALQSAEARLILAKTNLQSTVIKAPYDALVVERNLGLGQYISAGSAIAVLYNISSAEIVVPMAKFDSQFLPANMAGQTVKVTLANSQLSLPGQLSRQLKLTDNATRTNSVIVTMKDLYRQQANSLSLQFGDYVEVEFGGKAIAAAYKIPESLLSNNRIWVVNPQSELEQRDVSVVRHENGFAIIDQGFQPLDKLVTTVPEYPYKGMPVKVIVATAELSSVQAVKEQI
jgi:multidrug efflux system membrane fusion protein